MTQEPFDFGEFLPKKSSLEFSRRALLRRGGLLLALQAAQPRSWRLLAAPLTSPAADPVGCFVTSHAAYPPQLEGLIAKLDPALDDFPTERYAEQLAKILANWSIALCHSVKDLKTIHGDLADSLEASPLKPSETIPVRTTGPLRIDRRSFQGSQATSCDNFLTQFAVYLSPFATLEVVELEIFGIRVMADSPLQLETDIRCDLVGIDEKSSREQRVGSWLLRWIRDEQNQWKVRYWTFNPEVRSRLTGPGFTEITAHCLNPNTPGMAQLLPGIDYWRSVLDAASGIDVYGNHGVAAGDIDGSGMDSFYVCQPSGLPNRLYKNRGDGTFEDITESSGTGILDGTASALFVDFRNRRVQDLLIIRTGWPLLFVNNGNGKFEPRPGAFHFANAPQGTFTSAAVADYNRDGLLDI